MTPARRARRWCAGVALVILLATSAGCRLIVELVESDEDAEDAVDAAGADAAVGPDASCLDWSFSPATFEPCELPAPTAALVLGDGVWTFDTNSGALTDPDQNATFPSSALMTPADGSEVRVLSVDRFELAPGAELSVRGERPLVLVSWSTALIAGVLDATSRPGSPGAGADPAACAATAASAGAVDVEGAGGGGGGGLGAAGAAGGAGNDALASAGTGGAASELPIALRGGCAGAPGGNALAGAGGPGGGAVYLAARDLVQVDGVITAGGAGGGAAQGGRSGGGGGGSGGYLGLASASIVIGAAGIVAANGGGGGGGSDGTPALPGQDGQATATPAALGDGQGMGGDGGAGGARDAAAAPGISPRRGGGGGGGGVGVIVIDSPDLAIVDGAIVSPAP